MPRLCLVNPNVCPPDGFRYRFPEDGFLVHAWTYNDWIQFGLNHCRVNNLSGEETLPVRMEEQLCLTLEAGWCMYDDPNRPRVSTSLTWDDVMGGLATFSSWMKAGMPYVEQKEAERRALICTRCYMNVHISGCSACQAAVETVVRQKHTLSDSSLSACAVCKCFLRAKVHFPLQLLLDSEREKLQSLYPEHCWLKLGGENFRGIEPGGKDQAAIER